MYSYRASVLKLKYHDVEFGLDVKSEKGLAESGDLDTDLLQLAGAVGEAAAGRSRLSFFSLTSFNTFQESSWRRSSWL